MAPAADGGTEWKYWALAKGSELAGHIKTKKAEYFEAIRRRGLDERWSIAYAQAFGLDEFNPRGTGGQTLAQVGPEGDRIRIRINEPRAYVNNINTIAQGQRPTFKCLSVNKDFGPNASASIARDVLTYVYREAMGEQREHEGMESAGWFGAAHFWLQWDFEAGDDVQVPMPVEGLPEPIMETRRSGAPTVTMLFPWEVAYEPYVKDSPWMIIRQLRSKSELCAAMPELAQRIQGVSNVTGADQPLLAEMFVYDTQAVTTDHVMVDHFYLKPCKAAKTGRWVAMCDDIELWDRPCPHPKRIPVATLMPHMFFGTRLGYANSWDILALQEAADELCSQVLSNFCAFGNQNVFMEEGTTIDEDALSRGGSIFTYRQGGKAPEALALAEMPAGYTWFLEFLYQRMGTILGLNSVSRGIPDESVKSGTHAALYDQIAIRFQSAYMAAVHFVREDVANLLLDMIKTYAETPFLVEIAGEDDEPYLKEFTRESVAGVRRVRVEAVSPAMESIPSKLEAFVQIAKLPMEQRRGALRAIETGDFSLFMEEPKVMDLYIRWENEQLCKGIPVMPGPGENPADHLPKHFAELWKQKTSDNPNMQAIQALQEHINQTIIQWQNGDPFTNFFMQVAPPAKPGTMIWQAAMSGAPLDPEQMKAPQQRAEGGEAQGGGKSPKIPGKGADGVPMPEPAQPPGQSKAA